jgi:hypothetical protein
VNLNHRPTGHEPDDNSCACQWRDILAVRLRASWRISRAGVMRTAYTKRAADSCISSGFLLDLVGRVGLFGIQYLPVQEAAETQKKRHHRPQGYSPWDGTRLLRSPTLVVNGAKLPVLVRDREVVGSNPTAPTQPPLTTRLAQKASRVVSALTPKGANAGLLRRDRSCWRNKHAFRRSRRRFLPSLPLHKSLIRNSPFEFSVPLTTRLTRPKVHMVSRSDAPCGQRWRPWRTRLLAVRSTLLNTTSQEWYL